MLKFRIWISRGVLLWLVVLLLFSLYFPVASRLSGEQFPSLFGLRQALVLTGSMEPAIHIGDLILIRSQTDYFPGDVVTFLDDRRLVTHRIIQIQSGHLITQGDANNAPDRPVQVDQIMGKVVLRLPQIGTLAWFFKTPAGIVLVLLFVLIFSCWDYFASCFSRLKSGIRNPARAGHHRAFDADAEENAGSEPH